jgi:aminoglycoside phosphotransferase (APT) family kinase protein
MDANREAVWFLHGGTVPDYMRAHPDGEAVWQTVKTYWPQIQPVAPVLIHLDYWSGNILWHENRISAVVDWEEAAYGDPAVDLAYCLMELALEGMDEAADECLRVYQAASGQKVANLGLWQLAAAARPMTDPEGWFTRPQMEARFRRFIAQAMQRAAN